jgi:hypothetical protein
MIYLLPSFHNIRRILFSLTGALTKNYPFNMRLCGINHSHKYTTFE